MSLFTRRKAIIGSGMALLVGGGVWSGLMGRPESLTPAKVFAVEGIAIRGTDPVAYFTDDKPMAGRADINYDWAGARWQFASAENRAAFIADPQAYAPQYGGFCAWAVAAKGKLYSTQAKNWSIIEGKLYLNYSDQIQAIWDMDRPGFIKSGDQRWPELMGDMT